MHQNRQAQYPKNQSHPHPENSQEEKAVVVEEELEIVLQEDPVEQALQKNPDFLKEVSEEALHIAPNIFQIEMETYPLCPWKRVDPKNPYMSQQYRQWFNYNLTPRTWTRYAESQKKVQERLKELMAENRK
jgi:septum formation topological specificity factor MinE